MKQTYDKFLDKTEETLRSRTPSDDIPDNSEGLFEGMDDDYTGTQTTFLTGNGYKDKRAPFSKYVEHAMKRNQANITAATMKAIDSQERIMEKQKMNRSVEHKDSRDEREKRSLNRSTLKIKPNFFTTANPGKFFKVRLKPLNNQKERRKDYIKESNKTDGNFLNLISYSHSFN